MRRREAAGMAARRAGAGRVLAIVLPVLLAGCFGASELERAIPASALRGAVRRAEVTDVQQHRGQKVRGDILITASATIPSESTNAQLRPTGMTLLKKLKEKYPSCEWFIVNIYDDPRAARMSHAVAVAEWREGKAKVTGGIPDDREIGEYNARLREKAQKGAPVVELARPGEEDMNVALKADEVLQAYREKMVRRSTLKVAGPAMSDEALERETAAHFDITPERVRLARFRVFHWYGLHRGRVL